MGNQVIRKGLRQGSGGKGERGEKCGVIKLNFSNIHVHKSTGEHIFNCRRVLS